MNFKSQDSDGPEQAANTPTAHLRVLETTDLHMQLLGYDYFNDQVEEDTGLIQLADLIETLRADPEISTVLFDNGDFIQGNPLADYLASESRANQVHPMIKAFNTLRYDAVTLGNHEFNYGLPFLRTALSHAAFDVVCANVKPLQGTPFAQPFAVIDRQLACSDGKQRALKIGITGFVTPQILDWDKTLLEGVLQTDDIIGSATTIVPQMQAAGADVVIALCHSGIGAVAHTRRMENAAVPLAAIDGIDVVLTGHTHEVFPDENRQHSDVMDPVAGTLHGKPTVMAGFLGNWLGVVDLQLSWERGRWTINGHRTRLEQSVQHRPPTSPLKQTLTDQVSKAHAATLAHIRQPIAKTDVPIHSYFATIAPDLSQELLARAQSDYISRILSVTDFADLPVLSATAPFRFGGRAGPGHYIDIAPGPLTLRDAAAIYPFTNALCAVRRTGAEIRVWLERAAAHFMQITPGMADQPLINTQGAAYNFDTIYGLTYALDLTAPARFGPDGTLIDPDANRLRDLKYRGRAVSDDDHFVVATNSYRTHGGGGFGQVRASDVLHSSRETTRDILVKYLQKQACVTSPATRHWQFSPVEQASAKFQSAPAASAYLCAGITAIGPGQDGFDIFRLTF